MANKLREMLGRFVCTCAYTWKTTSAVIELKNLTTVSQNGLTIFCIKNEPQSEPWQPEYISPAAIALPKWDCSSHM